MLQVNDDVPYEKWIFILRFAKKSQIKKTVWKHIKKN